MVLQARTDSAWLPALLLLLGSPADAAPDNEPPYIAGIIAEQPAADFRNGFSGAELESAERQAFAGLLGYRVDTLALDLGLDYQYTRYEYEGIDGRNRDLHRLQLPLTVVWDSAQWQFRGYLAPGISTSSNVMKDLSDDATGDDFFMSGRLVAAREAGARSWFAGLAYDRSFGRPTAYPVAGVEYSPDERLTVRLAFPDPGVRLNLTDRQTLTGHVYPAGHQWHVVSDELDDDFDYRVEGIRSQLNWNYRLARALSIDFCVAYEFAREHDFVDDLGVPVDAEIEDQWLIAIGLRVGGAVQPRTHGAHLGHAW